MDYDTIIIGGGITGVGVMHDLASRGITRTLLLEKSTLAFGTSSRSTKLIHGGIRYLEHLNQWPLVYAALQERNLFLSQYPQLVKPISIALLNIPGGRHPALLQCGLWLYDILSGGSVLPASHRIPSSQMNQTIPYLKNKSDGPYSGFMYYDGQTQDDIMVQIIAKSAEKLGASYQENTEVTKIIPYQSGYEVTFKDHKGTQTVRCHTIVNSTGPWNNWNLKRWNINPKISVILNPGSHLVYESKVISMDEKALAGVLIQQKDGRVLFFLPWYGKWILGTTESKLESTEDLDDILKSREAPLEDIQYLKKSIEPYIDLDDKHLLGNYWGVRTLPYEGKNISRISREMVLDETLPGFYSIYGGKYSTYRRMSAKVGARITLKLGKGSLSKTHCPEMWWIP